MKTLTLLVCMALSISSWSQDASAYRKMRDYYLEHTIYRGAVTNLVYDKKTFKVAVDDDFIVPILSLTFRYEQVTDSISNKIRETVVFDCTQPDCIFERENLKNTSSCRVLFHKKEECLQFIKLISDFRFAIELRRADKK